MILSKLERIMGKGGKRKREKERDKYIRGI